MTHINTEYITRHLQYGTEHLRWTVVVVPGVFQTVLTISSASVTTLLTDAELFGRVVALEYSKIGGHNSWDWKVSQMMSQSPNGSFDAFVSENHWIQTLQPDN
jgi:hypothetical protein